jgi:hypothetical protein
MPYVLYSKGFAKKGIDLNKNDFQSPHFKVKASGKMASGIKFTAEGSDTNKDGKYSDAKIEISMPVDDKFNVTLESNAKQETTVSAEMKVSKDATLKLVAANPDFANPTAMGVTGEFNFTDPKFAVETKFCLWDGPAVGKIKKDDKGARKSPFYSTGTHGVHAGFTFDCPGLDKVTVGLQPGIGLGARGMGFQMPLSIGWSDKDMSLAFVSGMAMIPQVTMKKNDKGEDVEEFKGHKPDLACAGLKGHFKISDELMFGFEADQQFYKLDGKKLWATKSVEKKAATQTFKCGLQYSADKSTTYKVKTTFTKGSGLDVDLAMKTALAGKNSLVASCTIPYAADAKPSVGVTYNLEA